MTVKTLLIASAMGLAAAGAVNASTLYVDVSNQNDPLEDGSLAHPFDEIQEAIDVSFTGDEIIVAPGVYPEAIDYGGRGVSVCSSDGANVTSIDASSIMTDVAVVTFDNMETAAAKLKGFTVTGGTGLDDGFNTTGGGLRIIFSGPMIDSCVISGNTADKGAGVYCFLSTPSFANCVIVDNEADLGGAMYCEFASGPFLEQCTVVDNTAMAGGGFYLDGSSVRCINCIVWGNNDDSFASVNAELDLPVVTYSNAEACIPCLTQAGNIDVNPQFVNLNNGNLRLTSTSPCIDAADSREIAEDIFTDLDGDKRGVDDPDTVDTGVPVFGLTVDMGAYEFQVTADCGECTGDINGDGAVDVLDLLLMLGSWGACP